MEENHKKFLTAIFFQNPTWSFRVLQLSLTPVRIVSLSFFRYLGCYLLLPNPSSSIQCPCHRFIRYVVRPFLALFLVSASVMFLVCSKTTGCTMLFSNKTNFVFYCRKEISLNKNLLSSLKFGIVFFWKKHFHFVKLQMLQL